jgi:hypothetical protein
MGSRRADLRVRESGSPGRAIRAEVVSGFALTVSDQRCALRAPRFPIVFFPAWDEESPSARCFQDGVSASRLSSIPSSPVLECEPSADSALRFHSSQTFSLISAKYRLDRATPTVSTHSKVSDVSEISRVRTRALYERSQFGRIDWRDCLQVGARGFSPA